MTVEGTFHVSRSTYHCIVAPTNHLPTNLFLHFPHVFIVHVLMFLQAHSMRPKSRNSWWNHPLLSSKNSLKKPPRKSSNLPSKNTPWYLSTRQRLPTKPPWTCSSLSPRPSRCRPPLSLLLYFTQPPKYSPPNIFPPLYFNSMCYPAIYITSPLHRNLPDFHRHRPSIIVILFLFHIFFSSFTLNSSLILSLALNHYITCHHHMIPTLGSNFGRHCSQDRDPCVRVLRCQGRRPSCLLFGWYVQPQVVMMMMMMMMMTMMVMICPVSYVFVVMCMSSLWRVNSQLAWRSILSPSHPRARAHLIHPRAHLIHPRAHFIHPLTHPRAHLIHPLTHLSYTL